jgi:hypothetical protein
MQAGRGGDCGWSSELKLSPQSCSEPDDLQVGQGAQVLEAGQVAGASMQSEPGELGAAPEGLQRGNGGAKEEIERHQVVAALEGLQRRDRGALLQTELRKLGAALEGIQGGDQGAPTKVELGKLRAVPDGLYRDVIWVEKEMSS